VRSYLLRDTGTLSRPGGEAHPSKGGERESWRQPQSSGRFVHLQIALRRNTEGVRHPIEEGEHGCDVNRFGDLRIRPTVLAQDFHIFRGRAVGRLGHPGDIFEQCAVWGVESCVLKVAVNQRLNCLFLCSLNPQEVRVRIQSIRTAIQKGDPAGNRLFRPARKMALGKVDRIAKTHDFAKEIGAMAEAFEDSGHILAPRLSTPFVVYLCNLAGRFRVLDQLDFGFRIRHGLMATLA
jgi:hypothetical protein